MGSVIISGCGRKKWLSDSELFEKKKECANYEFNYMKEMKALDKNSYLEELFYSPKLNTCIAGVSDWMVWLDWYIIEDVLTRKKIQTTIGNYWWSEEAYNNKIKELKWE